MPNHDEHVKILEEKVTALSDALAHLGKGTDAKELLRLIRWPGYTTPAEWVLHLAILENMQTQVNILNNLGRQLVEAGKLITSQRQAA